MFYLRKIKKPLIITGLTFLLISIILFIIAWSYGDNIIKVIISQINKNVKTEITVKEVNFSIFRRFPYGAVVFNDFTILPAKDFKTTQKLLQSKPLLKAKRVYVEVNLFRIAFKDYTIHKIVVENGETNILMNEKGDQNFSFINQDNKSESAGKPIEFSKILLKNVNCQFIDLKHSIIFDWKINKVQFFGDITSKGTDLVFNIDIFSKNLKVQNREYLNGKNIKSGFTLKYHDSYYEIHSTNLNIDDVQCTLGFSLTSGKSSNINLNFDIEDQGIGDILNIMPADIGKYFLKYKCKGNVNARILVEGNYSGKNYPKVWMTMNLKNGEIIQKSNGVKLSRLNLEASYSNGSKNELETSTFHIRNFTASFNDNKIKGQFTLINLEKPHYDIEFNGDLNLEEVNKFLALESIEKLSGKLNTNIHLNFGLFSMGSLSRENIQNIQLSGTCKLVDAALKIKGYNYLYNNINTEILLGNDFQILNLSLNIDNNDFFIKGKLNQVIPYFLKQSNTISLQADLRSAELDLSKYFEKTNQTKTNSKYNANVLFPLDLTAELNVSISKFSFMKFQAKNVLAHVNYKPGMYTLNSVIFESMRGKVSGNGAVMKDINKKLYVKSQTSLKNIDINQLFYSFGNFGQNILLSKHLKGSLTGEVLFSCDWNDDMNINKDDVLVESNLKIVNGELINFEPMAGLSRFISLSELKDIKFSNLQNQVYIRHQQIIIPQMEINSTAFNITGNGIHNFDNHYTYNINVLLSEVLAKKAKTNKKENDEYGIEEDDGLGRTRIPLVIIGFDNEYKISYNTKGMKENIKESLKSQKGELKSIFKEEFGMFKNDSTVKVKPKNNTKFKIKWEEEPDVKKDETTPKSKKKKTFEEEEGYKIEFEK